jgi:DNA-directed RNA polymerase subunit RPC12/RpoP
MAIETIGEALDAGWRLTARCAWGKREAMKTVRACIQTYQLDLRTLVWTRGRAFPLSSLESRLRCPRCGSRRIVVMFQPPPIHSVASARCK